MNKKPVIFISDYLYYILVAIVLLTSFSLFFLSIDFLGIRFFTVRSESMQPIIKRGDIIKVKQKDFYEINDIITYYKEDAVDQTITHRIIRIESLEGKKVYFTKGDNNTTEDIYEIQEQIIVGKVTTVIPKIGIYLDFAKGSPGYYIIVIIPGILIVIREIIRIDKLKKQKH